MERKLATQPRACERDHCYHTAMDSIQVTAISETCAFFFPPWPVAIQLPRLTQNGWLPILDTYDTSHFDNKLLQEG